MLLAFCTSTIHLQAMDEWDGKTIAKGFYSGTGTKADPYRIFTASQFLYFLQQTKDGNTFGGKHIELCNDIAFKSNEGLVEGGDFYGDFDGNDHTIQVNKYKREYEDYIWGGWHLFNLYGSMHDVLFVRANYAMTIYTGGILYNCRFEFPSSYPAGYHGDWTVLLKGGTIANCVSNSASWKNRLEQGRAGGFVSDSRFQSSGYCLNCYFPITSYPYSGSAEPNYYGVIESCGEEAGNDWVLSHTEYAYKSWPLTFNPTYPEYQIQEQPHPYNPSVVYTHSNEALYQWCYQKRKPITFEDIANSTSTQTKTIAISDDNGVLSFDFETHGYVYTGYNDGSDKEAWISINGEKIVSVYDEKVGTYSCPVSAGTYEISCERSDITNICITYPTETLANETASTLSKQTIMEKPGAYFCQVSYGEGCDVMYSDYVDYEKLLTIDNVTYVINEDATATVLWADDMAVDITILETVNYNDVNYRVNSISSKAFADCQSLASIKCKTFDVPALLGETTFEGLIPSNVTLYVPKDSKSAYSTTEGWKYFDVIIEIGTIIKLIDGQTFDNNDNIVMDEISYTRTLNNTAWNALYVPFEIPVSQLTDNYDIAYVNAMHSYDMDDNGEIDKMEMEVVKIKEGTLHANYPYLIRAKNEEAKAIEIVVENSTLYAAESVTVDCSSVFTKFEITGTYQPLTNEDIDGCYALSGGSWKTMPDDATLNPFRLYLRISDREGSPVKIDTYALEQTSVTIRVQGEEPGTTSIEEMYELRMKNDDATIYNLMGQPVKNPVKGSIYIQSGRKVVW